MSKMGEYAREMAMYTNQGFDFMDSIDDVPPEREAWDAYMAISNYIIKAKDLTREEINILSQAEFLLKRKSNE